MLESSVQLPPNTEVVWEPVEGSAQEFALDTRADHTLLFGTRGSGKTITQLMFFRRFVGLGYGSFLRGVIFDTEYKNLADLEAQSRRYFNQFNDGAKFLSSVSDYMWQWPTGEALLFRHVKKITDYERFHGHEYCLWENEEIITDKGHVAIKNLNVGDNVLTPAGYRKVTKKVDVGLKNCVKVSTYTSDGRLHSEQLQSEDHHLLTSKGEFSQLSVGSFRNVPLFVEKSCSQESFDTLLPCVLQENGDFFVQQGCEETVAKLSDKYTRSILLNQTFRLWKELPAILLRKCLEKLPRLSTLYRDGRVSFELLKGNTVDRLKKHSDHRPLREWFLQVRDLLVSSLHVLQADGSAVSRKVSNLLCRCFSYLRQCDGLVRNNKETCRYVVPSQPCVQDTIPVAPSGVSESLYDNNHPSVLVFEHPYLKGTLIRSSLELSQGCCKCESWGALRCFDIEVEEVNCYITKSGLINKNCIVGFNELTKWPTPDLYDRFMSVNRSSFVPEKHTPSKVINGKRVYDTPDGQPLPPIPLKFMSTTNSSGPGRSWVKKRFVDPAPYGELVKKSFTVYSARQKKDISLERTQVCIFSSFRENPYLPEDYIASLYELTENNDNLRKSWLEGSWDITAGGALDDLWDSSIHVIDRFPVPFSWRIDRSFDWGSSHPFAVAWWAEADGTEYEFPDGTVFCPAPGSLIMVDELYGTKEVGTNKGLVMSAVDVAKGVIDKEVGLMVNGWVPKQPYPGPADNQIRNVIDKKIDTIEKLMAKEGVRWTKSDKSPGSRAIGLQLVRDRLEAALKGEGKALYFMRNCVASIETIPVLPRDEKNMDDVDTEAEDHLYDCTRYRILAGSNRYAHKLTVQYPT